MTEKHSNPGYTALDVHPGANTEQSTAPSKHQLSDHNDELVEVFRKLNEVTTIDFGAYQSAAVTRWIEHRMDINNTQTLPEYVALLEENSEEIELLRNDLLSGVTHFFRNDESLDLLGTEFIPLIQQLMTANVELQSTNEELQSLNVKLYAINEEYRKRVTAQTDRNDDLDNLLNSTGYAIIFLDNTLSIRSFTRNAAKFINLLPSDIERSISDLTLGFDYYNLLDDLNKVLRDGQTIEHVAAADSSLPEGQNLAVTMRQYISADESINGVVMTIREM